MLWSSYSYIRFSAAVHHSLYNVYPYDLNDPNDWNVPNDLSDMISYRKETIDRMVYFLFAGMF